MTHQLQATMEKAKCAQKKYYLVLILCIGMLIGSIILAASIGSFQVEPSDTYRILLYKLFGIEIGDVQSLIGGPIYNVIWKIRFPRVLLGLAVGAGLALCGCIMQACVQNPLAEPYILGISSGASFGATFSIMLGISAIPFLPVSGIAFWSFLGAMGASVIVLKLSSMNGRASSTKLILAGTVVNALCTAFSNFIISVASNAEGMQSVKFWTMGSLATAKWENIATPIVCTALACLYFLLQTKKLNTMLVGDEVAMTLGTDLNKYRRIYMVIISILTGVLVASCGIIGFVGLVIPHVVRAITGADHRRLLPICILVGGIFLVWADAIARIIIPNAELSIGIITSLVGAPFFAYILIKRSYSFKES